MPNDAYGVQVGDEQVETFVLDTNAWLDWFVFDVLPNSPMANLQQVISRLQVNVAAPVVLMTSMMWLEWVDVLGRQQFGVDPHKQASILTQTRALVRWVDEPAAVRLRLRCKDVDDQVFIDTSLCYGVTWLISKDKHLLNLRTRAAKHGVRIVTPEQWHGQYRSKHCENAVDGQGGMC